MKRFTFSAVFFVLTMQLFAQQDYFVFIQESSGLPFYVRIGDKSYSSSAGGHLILSQLKDSTYKLYIGFPKNGAAEQLFSVSIDNKDRGFELKNMNGEWQLFDLQTLQLQKSVALEGGRGEMVKKTDSYSRLMANVVNDSAVLYNEVAREGVVKKKDSTAVKKIVSDPAITPEAEAIAEPEKPVPAATIKPSRPSVMHPGDIIRYGTENLAEGKLFIFLDRTGPATDTIKLIIPRL